MHRTISIALVLIVLLTAAGLSAKEGRIDILGKENRKKDVRIHPIEKLMGGGIRKHQPSLRNNNKLLVILAEFQPDTNPQTTGDGTFQMDGSDYPVGLGAPPHDHTYFEKIMESVRYYYMEVSQGYYNLDCDVYPRDGTFYRLPQEMAYYNPPGASSSTMLSRFEEYFKDVLQTADADPRIDFSDYGHFMVIHAGADWQHDVMGNTPGDLPSFYITIGDGKEVSVDDGAKMIKHLCNVPETIVQDTSTYTDNGIVYHDGYGVTNAVTAHEFGHSLGFVDLYNTSNFRPSVGYWDIMDSGGATVLTLGADEDDDGILDNVYLIEGGIPALPGAFHKELAWGDEFRAQGLIKDITDFDLSQPIDVIAATKPYDGEIGSNQAYIVKVPLSDTEYILIENRQTDYDDDGETVLVGDSGEDSRVILYPTGKFDNLDTPDEYDFALPDWIDQEGNSYGGGLIMWHIDEDVIYNQGYYESDGEFVSNFTANSVNTKYSRRGVFIIEADGLEDIGNVNSLYWQGTVYEPFFRYKPMLDPNGFFTGWDIEKFNDEISASTNPALVTNDGEPSMFTIYDIDSEHYSRPFHIPPEIVSFRFKVNAFDQTTYVPFVEIDSVNAIGGPGLSSFLPGSTLSEFPVFSRHGVNIISHLQNGSGMDEWQDILTRIPLDFTITQPPLTVDYDLDGYDEFIAPVGNEIFIVKAPDVIQSITFEGDVTSQPMKLKDGDLECYIVSTDETLFKFVQDTPVPLGIENARMAADENSLYAFADGVMNVVDYKGDFNWTDRFEMPFTDTDYEPVVFTDTLNATNSAIFMLSNDGALYKIQYGKYTRIFEFYPYTAEKPTNLAIGAPFDDGKVYLIFGAGDHVFAIDTEGVMAYGFPVKLEDIGLQKQGYPVLIDFMGESIALIPAVGQGFLAIDMEGKYRSDYSMCWNGESGFFFWEKELSRLNYVYGDYREDETDQSRLCRIGIASIDEMYENPIEWAGYRNGSSGCYRGAITHDPAFDASFSVVAYPNPVSHGQLRIRVEGATEKIELKIYNIAGDQVLERSYEPDESIRLDTRSMASGLYFGKLESGGNRRTIKFGIEK